MCLFSVFPAGDSVPSVRLRGKVHLHVTHTWRTSDLSALQLLQVRPLCWRHAGEEALNVTDRHEVLKQTFKTAFKMKNSPAVVAQSTYADNRCFHWESLGLNTLRYNSTAVCVSGSVFFHVLVSQ